MTAFEQAFTILMGHEGGYVDNPADPGGPTKYGISKRAHPTVNIPELTLEGAKAIYLHEYWHRCACDDMDPALALIVFDAAVNNGPNHAIKWLQTALGVAADGKIGPVTRAAMMKATGDKAFNVLAAAHGDRIRFMAGLSTWPKFSKGWSRRLAGLPFQAAGMGDDNGEA